MLLPKGTIVAVADGEKFSLFSNTGDEAGPTLTPMAEPDIENVNTGSGASNQNESQAAESNSAAKVPGCVKTCTRQKCAELFSPSSSTSSSRTFGFQTNEIETEFLYAG